MGPGIAGHSMLRGRHADPQATRGTAWLQLSLLSLTPRIPPFSSVHLPSCNPGSSSSFASHFLSFLRNDFTKQSKLVTLNPPASVCLMMSLNTTCQLFYLLISLLSFFLRMLLLELFRISHSNSSNIVTLIVYHMLFTSYYLT